MIYKYGDCLETIIEGERRAKMTDSMVERLARAICFGETAAMWDCACKSPSDCKKWSDHHDQVARAAIEAMREPTQKMTDAVLLGDLDPWVIDDNWRAMIDAALAEPVPK